VREEIVMLKLLRTATTCKGREQSDPLQDLLGVFWGSGVLELFFTQGETMKTWKSSTAVHDAARFREAVLNGLQQLGGQPRRAVLLILHPELQQLPVEVPAAAAAPVIQALVRRSIDQQMPVSGRTLWCDVPLVPAGDRARRLVYAMPEVLHRGVRDVFRDIGIDLHAMIPFSGLVFLGDRTAHDREAVVLDAWYLPCGIAVGLRRGPDFWMVRPLTMDPDDVPRVSRELRQTLGFARQRWDIASFQMRLRGPAAWVGALTESLRIEGLGKEVIGGGVEEDWRHLMLRRAVGSCVDLVPAASDRVRRRSDSGSPVSRSFVGTLSSGLILSTLMLSEGYRIRTQRIGAEREARAAEVALEDLEAWSNHRDQLVTLAKPWTWGVRGIPVRELPTRLGEWLPDELVLTELGLWRSESVWHLALSGRMAPSEKAEGVRPPLEVAAQLEADLVACIGARSVPVMPTRTSPASSRATWAERLASEPPLAALGDEGAFRKEWILP
jgi:hypothetical protein